MIEKLRVSQIIDRFRQPYTGSTNDWKYWPTRTASRGTISCPDLKSEVVFQFNPTEVTISKQNNWEYRTKTGHQVVDPIWSYGGNKSISFKLTFDATIGMINSHVGGKTKFSASNGIDIIPNMEEHHTVEYPNGTLDLVQTLEEFQYPLYKTGKPRFIQGNALVGDRFAPPPDIILTYGPYYYTCKLTSLEVKHTLFDSYLVPRRTECTVDLFIIEGLAITDQTIKQKDVVTQSSEPLNNINPDLLAPRKI